MKKILLFSIALVIGFFISSNTAKAQSGNNSNVNTPLVSVQASSINNAQTQNGVAPSGGGQSVGANITVTANSGSKGGLDLGSLDQEVPAPESGQTLVAARTFVRASLLSQAEINTMISTMKSAIQVIIKDVVFFRQSLR